MLLKFTIHTFTNPTSAFEVWEIGFSEGSREPSPEWGSAELRNPRHIEYLFKLHDTPQCLMRQPSYRFIFRSPLCQTT